MESFSWSHILSAQEYFKISKISYKHVCGVYDARKEGHGPRSDWEVTCFGIINEIIGFQFQTIITEYISSSNFHFLFLRELNLDNLFPISGLNNINIIDCSGNYIDSLVPLKNTTSLKELYMSHNKIHNIEPILGLGLEVLDLSDNKIDCIKNIDKLKHLRILLLEGNKITDISPIEYCNKIEYLNLSYNSISNFSYLKKLPYLKEVNLVYNDNSDFADLVDLCRLLPACKVKVGYPRNNDDECGDCPQTGFLILHNDLVYFVYSFNDHLGQIFYIKVYLVDTPNNQTDTNTIDEMKNIVNVLAPNKKYHKYTFRGKKIFIVEEDQKILTVKYDTSYHNEF